MIQRCTNQKSQAWKRYGARGISVCERWRKFENFLADMGLRPKGTSLGRYLDVGNYEPRNCQWMTRGEQSAEQRGKRAMLRYRAVRGMQHPLLAVPAAELLAA